VEPDDEVTVSMTQTDAQVPPAYPAYPGYPQGYQGYPGYAEGYPPPEAGRFTRLVLRAYARSPRWMAPAAVLGCFAGAAAFVLYTDPTQADADSIPTCLVKLTTGFDCPGCGGTRAFYYALHGNIPAAARHHAVFVFALPFLVYMYAAWAGERVFRRRLPQVRVTPRMIGIFLAAWGVFTVVRNLPWAPFSWLYV
jgi:hypothetical protein